MIFDANGRVATPVFSVGALWTLQLQEMTKEALSRAFDRDYRPVFLVDQFGRPVWSGTGAGKIGSTITVKRPVRFQA